MPFSQQSASRFGRRALSSAALAPLDKGNTAIVTRDSMCTCEFERVAMPHVESLLRVAMRLVHDSGHAEEFVQETLLRAWRTFDRFERGTNCKAWLFRILLNLVSRQQRRIRASPQIVSFDAVESIEDLMLPMAKPRLTAAEVISAFDTLSEEHRVVLMLAAVEGFTCKEIAVINGIPIGTVMSRLSRARVALREALGLSTKNRRPRAVCSDARRHTRTAY
jgi:RNA polymerase sigma-70 factor (ECF subfamily)